MLKHYVISFLISMVPLIELRGALPYALANGIPTLPAYIVCMVANMLPVPVIFFFARKVLEWGKDKKYIGPFFTWCLEKGHKAGRKLQEKAGTKGLFIALLLFNINHRHFLHESALWLHTTNKAHLLMEHI